jgi:hypothetical protein
MNQLEPTLPGDYSDKIYVPIFSFDGGIVWKGLDSTTHLNVAINRLKSALPDAWHAQHIERFRQLRCGAITIPLKGNGVRTYVEFSVKDFLEDADR